MGNISREDEGRLPAGEWEREGAGNPAVAALGCCLASSKPGSIYVNASVALGQIGQIARTVKDIEQARQWYGQVLGLPHLYSFEGLAFFDCGGTRLMLTRKEEAAAESILYWRVENIVSSYEGLQARGVEFVGAPHMIHRHADGTEEWMAFFKDPDGRPLALMSQARPETPRT